MLHDQMVRELRDVPDAPDGTLPTFLVIGAMKAGTTSLHQYLAAHPDIFMTTPKEPRYFADGPGANFDQGLDWYRSLFAPGAHHKVRGESSTHYTKAPKWSGVPERIAKVIPDVRMVYLLRDPIDRIRSMYAFLVFRDNEQRSFEQVAIEDSRYVDWSLYAYQLELYLEHFDRSQILVLWSDDLRHRRDHTVGRILSFIGLDPDISPIRSVLAKEINTVEGRTQPMRIQAPAGRMARYTPLRFLPPEVKNRLSRLARRHMKPPDTTLTPALEAHLWSQIVDDNKRLESIVGEAPPWMERRA